MVEVDPTGRGVREELRRRPVPRKATGPLRLRANDMGSAPLPLEKQLIGTDEATIDEKGRLLMSKKKRERLGEPFVMAMGPTGCLVAYTVEAWNSEMSEVMENPSTNLGRQQLLRMLSGSAEDDLRFDKQGRVVVPQRLREAAKLKDKVVIVGCIDRLEVWAAEAWKAYEKDPDGYGKDRLGAFQRAKRQLEGKE
jgi:MraZ protein